MKNIIRYSMLALLLMMPGALAYADGTRKVLCTIDQNNAEGQMLSAEDVISAKVYARHSRLYFDEKGKVQSGWVWPDAPSYKRPVVEGMTVGETVSRNEFGISSGYFPAPDGKKVAWYCKDESRVSDFPLLDISTRTGSLMSIKYPMIGMDSEHVKLLVCDNDSNEICWIQVDDFSEERYLTNITWSPDSKYIFIQVLDRSQHHMRLNMYRADNGSFVRTILTEDNDAWVEPLDPLYFIKGSYQFLYRTDNRDGYRNLYLCDTLGTVKRLTCTEADVQYVANDGRYVYYTSAEVSPIENHLFKIDIKSRNAKPVRLTTEEGWHRVKLSPDCKTFIDQWSSFNNPGSAEQKRTKDGKTIEKLYQLESPLAEYATAKMEFGTVPSADGKFDNYYRLFYPVDFDPTKQYPLVVYVYGGPHSQMVTDEWLGNIRMWEMLMAQKGYVVYVQDNRGTQNRGAEFEKSINRQCGQMEMQDQMVGVQSLLDEPWIDKSRVGVHGWSYGGFMTISLITNYPEVFKVGVAGGPVIDWKWYEVMYGERYMDTPETNPEGFEKTSLINKAADLEGKLLIIQGAIDNTVVWEHSLSFVQACIEKGILLDYFPYPRTEHNVGGVWRAHLYKKITDYFESNL